MKNLSPADFYSVRNALGLSLSTVAKESEINRNYLSNFEKKKYFLDETTKAKLRDYYLSVDPSCFESLDVAKKPADELEEANEKIVANPSSTLPKASAVSLLSDLGYKLVDGRYVVPSEMDVDFIEEECEEIQLIDKELNELLSEDIPLRTAFLGGKYLDKETAINKAIKAISLLARKQLHHDRMQGFPVISSQLVDEGSLLEFEEEELSDTKVHHLVSRLIHPDNQLLQSQ